MIELLNRFRFSDVQLILFLQLLLFLQHAFNMSSSKSVKMVQFNNGELYPILGMGTWQATPGVNESERSQIYQAVKSAVDIGYRHFDCADFYNNQKSVGKAIAEKIKEGVIKREDIYVTSKLWNNKHNPKDVEITLKQILNDLGLDDLDLFLIHWPFATKDDVDSNGQLVDSGDSYVDTWKAMERCVRSGLTKSIGVSNFNVKQIKDILEIAEIKPVVNQVENHPYLTQNTLKKVCETNGILLTAYGPLGSPYRSGATADQSLLDEPVIKKIAQKYNKTTAQILIKFQIQRGIIVIPKSSNPERLKENFDVWDFQMSQDEMDLLESLNKNLRYVLFENAIHLKDYPFNKQP